MILGVILPHDALDYWVGFCLIDYKILRIGGDNYGCKETELVYLREVEIICNWFIWITPCELSRIIS